VNFHRYVLARYCIETCEATNGTRDDIYIYHVTLRWVETTCQVWCLQPRSANLEFKSFKLSMVRCWNSGSLMICVHLISPLFHMFSLYLEYSLSCETEAEQLCPPHWLCLGHVFLILHGSARVPHYILDLWRRGRLRAHISRQVGKSNLNVQPAFVIFPKQIFLLRHAPRCLGDSSEKPSASEDVHCLQLMLRLSPKKDIAKKNQACGCVLGYALIHGHWNRDTGF
jgi:hypothetical protein